MTDTTPITRDRLVAALHTKTGQRPSNETLIADAIRLHGLEHVIAGRSDGKPVTFARAFEVVFGRKL